jgi:hypothetical protein
VLLLAVHLPFWQSAATAHAPPGLPGFDLLQVLLVVLQLAVVHWLLAEHTSVALLRLHVVPPQSPLRQSPFAAQLARGYDSVQSSLQVPVVQSVAA